MHVMTYADFLIFVAAVLLATLHYGSLWHRSADFRRRWREGTRTPAERRARIALAVAATLFALGAVSMPLGIFLGWPPVARLAGGAAFVAGAALVMAAAFVFGWVTGRPRRWVQKKQRPTSRVPTRPPDPPAD